MAIPTFPTCDMSKRSSRHTVCALGLLGMVALALVALSRSSASDEPQQRRSLFYKKSATQGYKASSACSDNSNACGGDYYVGPTTCCDENYVCTYVTNYFSQCIEVPTDANRCVPADALCKSSDGVDEYCCQEGLTCTQIDSSSPYSKCQTPQTPTVEVCANYGQCGGQGWTGCTTCAASYLCVYLSDFFSQCEPVAVDSSGCLGEFAVCSTSDGRWQNCCQTGLTCTRVDNESFFAKCQKA